MLRLRTAAVVVALAVTAGSGLSASPAAAADAVVACDPALAPGLSWSAPSFLAWGREGRVGANVDDPAEGPIYAEDSVAFAVDAGKATAVASPFDSDLEFAITAPTRGASVTGNGTWTLADDEGTTVCAQAVAVNVPLGAGKMLRYAAKARQSGVAWTAIGAGDCHDVALEPISLTVQEGGVTRRLTATDQCKPAGAKRISTRNWELALKNGGFELRALTAQSSLKTRLRYALRVGARRVDSGSLSLVRVYKPGRSIVVADQDFQNICVHSIYPMQRIGTSVGCKIPGTLSVRLKLV